MSTIFKGVATALITPFKDNTVDVDRFREQIEFQIASGVDALVVLGTTGEPSTLDGLEQKLCIQTAIQQTNHRVPVIVGTSSNNTSKAVQLSFQAQELGADALLITTPYYNKCTKAGIIEHYNTIAKSTSLPIIAYNVPSRTGVNIEVDTVKVLSKIKNIVALKEASGNISQISAIRQATKSSFDIYSGDDNLVVPTMSIGAIGTISVISNAFPTQVSELTKYCLSQKYKKANKLQMQLLPVLQACYKEVNPIGIKAIMQYMNMDSGQLRLPLTNMKDKNLENLYKNLDKYLKI